MATEVMSPVVAGVTDSGSMELSKCQTQLQKQVLQGDKTAVEQMVVEGFLWNTALTPGKETPVHAALRQKDEEQVKCLLKIVNLAEEANVYGETPLHLACRLGLQATVRRLLDMGVNINAIDKGECTPLYQAVHGRCGNCVRLLIQAGCDIDALTFELLAPLDRALMYKDYHIMEQLMLAGCSIYKLKGHVYYRDHYANSFFCALWDCGALDIMRLFFECGYVITGTELSSLKGTCYQLRGHQVERDTLALLKEYTETPRSLAWLSRRSLRQTLMDTRCRCHTPMDAMIASLPLPTTLKQYVMLQEPGEKDDESSN